MEDSQFCDENIKASGGSREARGILNYKKNLAEISLTRHCLSNQKKKTAIKNPLYHLVKQIMLAHGQKQIFKPSLALPLDIIQFNLYSGS